MGFAIVQTNSDHPNGRVTWMQAGATPPKLKDPDEETIFRVPDSLVATSAKTREIAVPMPAMATDRNAPRGKKKEKQPGGILIPFFDITADVVKELGINVEADIEAFLADLQESKAFEDTLDHLKFICAIQSVLLSQRYSMLKPKITAYSEKLTDPQKAELYSIAEACRIPLDQSPPTSQDD